MVRGFACDKNGKTEIVEIKVAYKDMLSGVKVTTDETRYYVRGRRVYRIEVCPFESL